MVSLNSPKTIWQLPNISTASVNISRNDIMLLAHDVPPGGSGFYYHLSFGELFNSFTATNSLFGAVKIFNNSLSGSSIVYNKDQVDDKLSTKENTIVTLSPLKGGTGLNTYAKYDFLYASEINSLSSFSTAIDSVLTTDSNGAPTWLSITGLLSQVVIAPATPTTIGGVKTNSFSADPIVYLTSEIDLMLPSAINPLAVDSGGTGISSLTGEANKFITVNATEDAYQFSTIESFDGTVIVGQDVNGNVDVKLPQAIEIDSEVQFAKISIRTPNEGGGAANRSVLDIRSNSGGVRLPRIATTEYTTWTLPDSGSILYDSSTHKVVYHNGTEWKNLGAGEVPQMPVMDLNDLQNVTVASAATNTYLKKSSTDWVAGDFSTDVNSLITTARSTYTIGNLTGVFTSTGTLGQIASLDANGKITFIDNNGGGGGATNLDGLSDTVISSPSLSQVLYYDGSNWVNFSLDNIIDTRFGQRINTITISNATGIFNGTGTVGQVATYDSNGKITFTTPNNTTFDSLTDTTFNSLIVNDYPSFNGSAWVNRGFNSDWANLFTLNIPNLDVSTLTGLFDTTGTIDYLVAKSSTGKLKFVPATGSTYAFADLTGITLTSLANTSYLRYNGTVWVNNNFNTDVDARMIASASNFTVSNLTGVFNSTGTTGQLATRGSNGRITWVDDTGATYPSLDEVTDVTVLGAATDSYLKKSSTDWVAGNFTTDVNSLITTARSTYTIGNLTGLFAGTGTVGQVPIIAANGKLEFISSPALTSIAITNLSDVVITSPATDNVLRYNAGNWVNTAYSTMFDSRWSTVRSSVTREQLSGVFTGSGTTGQTLRLNASNLLEFIDSPDGSFAGLNDTTFTSLANLDYPRYNGTVWVNRNFNTDVDARADAKLTAASISTLTGVFAATGTVNQIATLNSGGKIVFTAPPPGTNSSNPVLIDSGGTGLTSYTGMAGKFLTVSPTEDSFNLSTITSTDNSIAISQASSGNFNLSVNAANAVPKQLFKSVSSSYSLVEADHGYMIRCSGGITITLSSGLSNGFQVTLFNESGGTITIITSGTLKSKNNTFSIQYGAINAIHQSSNVWYAVGDFDT